MRDNFTGSSKLPVIYYYIIIPTNYNFILELKAINKKHLQIIKKICKCFFYLEKNLNDY